MIGRRGDAEGMSAVFRESVRQHSGLFLLEGILLIVLGVVAMVLPSRASLAATLLFGWILLLSGGVGLVTTFRARHAPGFAWSLFSAIIGIVAGALLLLWPERGTYSLTLVLIAFLFAEGVVSIFYATEHRRGFSRGWGWMLASGLPRSYSRCAAGRGASGDGRLGARSPPWH